MVADECFSSFQGLEAHLDRLGLFHMDLTLVRVEQFIGRAGFSAKLPYIAAHVVGTNGKGSTAAFLERLAREHGLTTGLFTSPHFLTFRERIRTNGRMLDEFRWTTTANRVWTMAADLGLTYFELLTAIGLQAFAEDHVDFAVLEAGLGGRYDAVSAMPTDITVFTPFGLDHQAILGPDIAAIAQDKSCAMRGGGLAITGPQPPEALSIIRRVAADRGTILVEDIPPLPEGVRLGLAGGYQRDNARLALGAWRQLASRNGWRSDSAAERRALESAFLPGRFQQCRGAPPLILDGGHNAPGLEALASAVQCLPKPPAAVIFSCLKDKDLSAMAPLVERLTPGPIIVPGMAGNQRARDPGEVARFFPGRSHVVDNVFEALDLASRLTGSGNIAAEPVLACGSLYLLAEIYGLRPACLPEVW